MDLDEFYNYSIDSAIEDDNGQVNSKMLYSILAALVLKNYPRDSFDDAYRLSVTEDLFKKNYSQLQKMIDDIISIKLGIDFTDYNPDGDDDRYLIIKSVVAASLTNDLIDIIGIDRLTQEIVDKATNNFMQEQGIRKDWRNSKLNQEFVEGYLENRSDMDVAVLNGFTHKLWRWTGEGATTRHESNDGLIVPIDEEFEIINDATGETSNLMFPRDDSGSNLNGDEWNCYCEVEYLNTVELARTIKPISDINGTILIDNRPIFADDGEALTDLQLMNTYTLLKENLPIPINLTHASSAVGVDDKELVSDLLDDVGMITDVGLFIDDESGYMFIKTLDSEITNDTITDYINEGRINGISLEGLRLKDSIYINAFSLVKEPACPKCTINH
ncbi:MAG: hypothetical protein LBC39_02645 [Methanobrevibacter sp.]|jgi:hypothetical protein|nr:hypothetical protein [Candidatus Methanovirga aequatorialis]